MSDRPPLSAAAREETGRLIAAFSRWLESTPSYQGISPEAKGWRRLGKVGEEYGEAVEAWLGALGENPRKGVTGCVDEVVRELLDVAACALGAVESFSGNDGRSLQLLHEHVQFVCERVGAAAAEPLTAVPEGDDTGGGVSDAPKPSHGVEAAARAIFENRCEFPPFEELTPLQREVWLSDAQAAVDAAHPVLIAEVRRLRAERDSFREAAADANRACGEMARQRREARADADRLRRELAEQPGKIAAKIEAKRDEIAPSQERAWWQGVNAAAVVARSFTPAAEPNEQDSALPQHLASGQVAAGQGAAQTDRHSAEPSARQSGQPAPVREWGVRHDRGHVSKHYDTVRAKRQASGCQAVGRRCFVVSRVPGGEWGDEQ